MASKLLAALLVCTVAPGLVAVADTGAKDCRATVFVLDSLKKNPAVASPDGQYRVVLSGKKLYDDEWLLRVYRNQTEIGNFDINDLSGGLFVK